MKNEEITILNEVVVKSFMRKSRYFKGNNEIKIGHMLGYSGI